MFREQLYRHIKSKYNSDPEFLWARYPNYAVFRHSDNRKWFAIIMDVPRNKFSEKKGLDKESEPEQNSDIVDVLNVKLSDPLFIETLISQPGIYKGYHISSGNWISIFLDGTVPFEEICDLLAEGFETTAAKKAGKRAGKQASKQHPRKKE